MARLPVPIEALDRVRVAGLGLGLDRGELADRLLLELRRTLEGNEGRDVGARFAVGAVCWLHVGDAHADLVDSIETIAQDRGVPVAAVVGAMIERIEWS